MQPPQPDNSALTELEALKRELMGDLSTLTQEVQVLLREKGELIKNRETYLLEREKEEAARLEEVRRQQANAFRLIELATKAVRNAKENVSLALTEAQEMRHTLDTAQDTMRASITQHRAEYADKMARLSVMEHELKAGIEQLGLDQAALEEERKKIPTAAVLMALIRR